MAKEGKCRCGTCDCDQLSGVWLFYLFGQTRLFSQFSVLQSRRLIATWLNANKHFQKSRYLIFGGVGQALKGFAAPKKYYNLSCCWLSVQFYCIRHERKQVSKFWKNILHEFCRVMVGLRGAKIIHPIHCNSLPNFPKLIQFRLIVQKDKLQKIFHYFS